jgi:hypothetical protein
MLSVIVSLHCPHAFGAVGTAARHRQLPVGRAATSVRRPARALAGKPGVKLSVLGQVGRTSPVAAGCEPKLARWLDVIFV